MTNAMIEFRKEGFPIIRLSDEFFEVKAIDYWEFRRFKYKEVVKINYWKEADKGNWILFGPIHQIYAGMDTYQLKIFKENGGDWTYKTRSKNSDTEFEALIEQLKIRCGIEVG
ncbi:MAG: hypothetical protein NXI10_12630 [bacterium]|nr:hypothetical protein [bacterium]